MDKSNKKKWSFVISNIVLKKCGLRASQYTSICQSHLWSFMTLALRLMFSIIGSKVSNAMIKLWIFSLRKYIMKI